MEYQAKLEKAIALLIELQDVIEEKLPDYYFVSEAIASLNDFWVEVETDPELSKVIENL